MIVRALDGNGDWTFGAGKNNYKKNNDAIAQNVTTRLRSFLGDCFFDLEAGIDWWTLLGSKNLTGLSLAQRLTILNTAGITSLIELSTNLDENRKLTTSYSSRTVYSAEEPLTGTIGIL